jgi:hypothetical protein
MIFDVATNQPRTEIELFQA